MRREKIIKKVLALILVLCFLYSPYDSLDVLAAPYRTYDEETDLDYTDGEGADVVLKHTKEEGGAVTASYEVEDTRLTRNASYYMSMMVQFRNSQSWIIRVRNVTCKIKGKEVTGDMQFHLFKDKGTLQVDGKTIDNWPTFNDIGDHEWHQVTVRSTVDSFEIWIDGERGKGLYYKADVTDMVSNYTCPAVILGGYNTGTVRDIVVWNDGKDENPVMPADRVAQQIEALPDTIKLTIADTDRVYQAKEAYDKLSEDEKKFVINYDKLEQLLLSAGNKQGYYEIEVSGMKAGKYGKVFPEGVILHETDEDPAKYFMDTAATRNSTFYNQFVINMTEDSNCFDVYLRNQKHTVEGKTVTGPISLRIFKKSAAIVDSANNRLSEWANFKSNIFEGSHVITVESSADACNIWIDETKYELPDYLLNVTDIDRISATSGFYLGKTVNGTISDVRIWNNGKSENPYSSGDKARIAIYQLPELGELTVKDRKKIEEARSLYEELESEELKYAYNLDKLEQLESALVFLEEEGDHAKAFLSDEVPEVKEDYVNLISTGTLDIPPFYSSKVLYNAATHNIEFNDSHNYITTGFEGIEGISAEDTYLIKFEYTPHEYYYETETAAWMGLRITFSGYEVGGNGAKTVNKTQFAFMENQCAVIPKANGNAMPTDYLPTFVAQIDETYHVSMLCEQGKMKIWVNGEPIAYYDNIPAYPMKLEFEGSRCACDVKNIQLYNMSNPTEPELEETQNDGFKYIEDMLYDVEGISPQDRLNQKQLAFILSTVSFAAVVVAFAVVVTIIVLRKKKKNAEGGESNHEQKENS